MRSELAKLFVQRVVVQEKRDRYVGFIENTKNRKKFLDALDHKLESEIDVSLVTKSLDKGEWNKAAVLYSSSGAFGTAFSSLKEAYEQASPYGGWLILTLDGRAAASLGRLFRLYTIATIILMLVFGAWSGMEVPRVEAGLATPWLGGKERIFWYAYELWFICLALTLLRQRAGEREPR